jgi:L-rhamnose isomerase/sugar isomerase
MGADNQNYVLLVDTISNRGVDIEPIKTAIKHLCIETPSWGYGNSGTRFQVFPFEGAAKTLYQKMEDAALVHRLTGVCPSMAIHIPWDLVDDWDEAGAYAKKLGIAIGAVNPNLFQDEEYKFGSVCHPSAVIRKQAIERMKECIQIAQKVGSHDLSIWLGDGTNYPGQDDIRARKKRLLETFSEVYTHMPEDMRMLIEYKFFEPSFYHTDLSDWGMAFVFAQKLGQKAQVLVDLGHHPQGTNIEQIVAFLIDEGKLGGFHFNDRKYADDDLMVASSNPYQLFLIFHEIISARNDPACAHTVENIAYMLDQSHNIEPKVEGILQSVINVQTAYAKALIVNKKTLKEAQENTDVLGANRILDEAYQTDVRPLLAKIREEMGIDPDPIAAYRASGHAERVARERGKAQLAGGYTG